MANKVVKRRTKGKGKNDIETMINNERGKKFELIDDLDLYKKSPLDIIRY